MSGDLGDVGRALLAVIEADTINLADIPPEKLAAPTLGAYRRQHGITGWCDEAKVAFAVDLVLEAQRRLLIERLDSIMEFLAVGATPDQAMRRVVDLVDQYQHAGRRSELREVA